VLIEVIQELVREWSPQGISQYPELEKGGPQEQSTGYMGPQCTLHDEKGPHRGLSKGDQEARSKQLPLLLGSEGDGGGGGGVWAIVQHVFANCPKSHTSHHKNTLSDRALSICYKCFPLFFLPFRHLFLIF
jgi:hypothetical protein